MESTIIKVSASKSELIRSLMLAFVAESEFTITGKNYGSDVMACIGIFHDVGIKVVEIENGYKIIPTKLYPGEISVSAGESGLLLRMSCFIFAALSINAKIEMEGTLAKRNHSKLLNILKSYGVKAIQHDNSIEVKSKLELNSNEIDISESSQFLTGILYAAIVSNFTDEINVCNATSKPYLDLTIDTLKYAGYSVDNDNYKSFKIKKINNPESTISVMGDWSSAAYLMVAAACFGKMTFANLDMNSKQADKAIINILNGIGAKVTFEGDLISIEKANLNAFEYDATNSPDLIPALMVLATQCEGKSRIQGLNRLINKESNRKEIMIKLFNELKIKYAINDDTIIIEKSDFEGGRFDAANDHRIAMALAIMGYAAENGIDIIGGNAVRKSYPAFFRDLSQLAI